MDEFNQTIFKAKCSYSDYNELSKYDVPRKLYWMSNVKLRPKKAALIMSLAVHIHYDFSILKLLPTDYSVYLCRIRTPAIYLRTNIQRGLAETQYLKDLLKADDVEFIPKPCWAKHKDNIYHDIVDEDLILLQANYTKIKSLPGSGYRIVWK